METIGYGNQALAALERAGTDGILTSEQNGSFKLAMLPVVRRAGEVWGRIIKKAAGQEKKTK